MGANTLECHWAVTFWRLVHERQSVTIRVLEERHPEVVVFHGGEQVRRARECDPAQFELAHA
jgi:hypothetical protein